MLVTSFAPVLTPQMSVVILGSMPGQMSLRLNQYYAAPQNLFWPIMAQLFGIDRQLPYAERLELLGKAGVGLWDVLKHCDREGSLDTSIDEGTEVPNDFRRLFEQCPEVKALCFNGQKAEKAFRRHVIPSLPAQIWDQVAFITLPSTSPANTTRTQPAKVEEWKALLHYTQK
jgi:TDG/mug DNA glycosylase family protein